MTSLIATCYALLVDIPFVMGKGEGMAGEVKREKWRKGKLQLG